MLSVDATHVHLTSAPPKSTMHQFVRGQPYVFGSNTLNTTYASLCALFSLALTVLLSDVKTSRSILSSSSSSVQFLQVRKK